LVTQKNNWTKIIKDQEKRLFGGLSRSWFSILEIEKIGWFLTGTDFLFLGQWKCELMVLLLCSLPN
jgi:hypothetical protein